MITHEQILTLLNIKGLGWNAVENVCRGVSRTQNIHGSASEDIEAFFDIVERVVGTELKGAITLPDNPADLDAERDRCAEIIWP